MRILNFLLIGAAGYIAPRHLKAIKETGNNLVAAVDLSDSVGIMDMYFPSSEFFTSFEEFIGYVDGLLLDGMKIDYVSVCTPNYLHVTHTKWALARGLDVICEKPLVLSTSELESLQKYELEFNASVYSILQLRLHDSILQLKDKVDSLSQKSEKAAVELTYITSRGKWYSKAWKGSPARSGGLAFNIGIHFFDMLHYVFGDVVELEVHERNEKTVAGNLIYEKANVAWFLSIDSSYLPEDAVQGEKMTYRVIRIGDLELEFSGGFTELHTKSYEEIIAGRGFRAHDNFSSIYTAERISQDVVSKSRSRVHPLIAGPRL